MLGCQKRLQMKKKNEIQEDIFYDFKMQKYKTVARCHLGLFMHDSGNRIRFSYKRHCGSAV